MVPNPVSQASENLYNANLKSEYDGNNYNFMNISTDNAMFEPLQRSHEVIEEESSSAKNKMKKTSHSTSYKRNNFKIFKKMNHQTSITLTSQTKRRKVFDPESLDYSDYQHGKFVTGITTYIKEIQRPPAKFECAVKPVSVFSNRKRSQMKSNETGKRREPLIRFSEDKKQIGKRVILKDYSKILNYSEKLHKIFVSLPFDQMSVSPKEYDYQFPSIYGFAKPNNF